MKPSASSQAVTKQNDLMYLTSYSVVLFAGVVEALEARTIVPATQQLADTIGTFYGTQIKRT